MVLVLCTYTKAFADVAKNVMGIEIIRYHAPNSEGFFARSTFMQIVYDVHVEGIPAYMMEAQ